MNKFILTALAGALVLAFNASTRGYPRGGRL